MSKKAFINADIAMAMTGCDGKTHHQPVMHDLTAIVDTLKQAGVETASNSASNIVPNAANAAHEIG